MGPQAEKAICLSFVLALAACAGQVDYVRQKYSQMWEDRPQAPAAATETPIHDCDVLAADPDDPVRVGSGVEAKKVDVPGALDACKQALREEPNNSRFLYQYSRVLSIAGRDEEARRYGEKAADMGHPAAQYDLAIRLLKGGDTTRVEYKDRVVYELPLGREATPDQQKAVFWLSHAAEQNVAYAQNILGMFYERGGAGLPQDEAQAVRWYRKAAEQGLPEAQFRLGGYYLDGKGVPQDFAKAAEWFGRAATNFSAGEDKDQAKNLSSLAAKFAKLVERAEGGDVRAQTFVGMLYATGGPFSSLNDFKKSVKWLSKAARQGDAQAQYWLARWYLHGQGVEKDLGVALKWFSKAAQQGHTEAIEVVRRIADPQADFGFPELQAITQALLGALYGQGEKVAQDYREARKWFTLAANGSSGPISGPTIAAAQATLGAMYWEGLGVPQDFISAHMWYNLAASHGARDAAEDRDRLARRMTPAQIAKAQRLARLWRPRAKKPSAEAKKSEKPREIRLLPGGSGFFVSAKGHILTSQHVIEDCASVRVVLPGHAEPAEITGRDEQNDLAVLKADIKADAVATFRTGPGVQAGDAVVVVGFPLRGLLGIQANISTGTISALSGLGNDARFLQITAPVQPGSSGGPLLDESGNVVGIVFGKLNALAILGMTGDLPQNVNWAVKSQIAQAFLDANGVKYQTSPSRAKLSPREIGSRAKAFTVPVECAD